MVPPLTNVSINEFSPLKKGPFWKILHSYTKEVPGYKSGRNGQTDLYIKGEARMGAYRICGGLDMLPHPLIQSSWP